MLLSRLLTFISSSEGWKLILRLGCSAALPVSFEWWRKVVFLGTFK